MRIVIDGRMLGWTGIGRYTKNLLKGLEKLDKKNEYFVLVQKSDWKAYSPAKNFKKVECNIDPYGRANHAELPEVLRELKPDLVHFTHFPVPLGYNDPFVVTVHDLTLLDYNTARGGLLPSLVYTAKQRLMKSVLKHALTAAKTVITPTQFVADDLVSRFKVAENKLAVTYEAAEKLAGKPKKAGIKGPFILYAGNFYPHKNVAILIKALPEVLINHPVLKLVLVGPEDYFQGKLKQLAKKLGVEKSVVFPGFVEYERLLGFYKEAELFVFPSLSEGFGLGPLEAMAQGTPVLSSDASCMPEVLGEAAIYFDPHNHEQLAEEIDAALNSPEELVGLKKLGQKQATKYSWDKMAKQTLKIYDQALRTKF